MLKNFRFSSTWENFVKAVQKIKELVDSNKAYFAVGFLREFSLYMEDDVDLDESINTIIESEVIYLLRWYLDYYFDGKEIDEKVIWSAINAGRKEGIDEKELKQMVKNVQNKLEFVKDVLEIEYLLDRYRVKQEAVNLKLCDFKYNVYAYNLPDKQNFNFAIINMVCKDKLNGAMQGEEDLLVEHKRGESITFICDERDIDLWIAQLKEVQRKIKGES